MVDVTIGLGAILIGVDVFELELLYDDLPVIIGEPVAVFILITVATLELLLWLELLAAEDEGT
jgi:hypothetical protein